MKLTLKALRVNKELRLEDVANKLKINPSTLCLYELGKRKITQKNLDKLLKLYNCKYEDIFFK